VKITEFSFNSLLPESIRHDRKFSAASECLDRFLKATNDSVDKLLIYSRVDELDEATLNDLAWQFHVDFFDGWGLAKTVEEKRELIKNAIMLHWHKGTIFSVEKIPEILSMPVEIIEWWDEEKVEELKVEELGEEPLKRFEFFVKVDTNQKGSYDGFETDFWKLLNNLKNVRSHLKRIIQMIKIKQPIYLGATTVSSHITTVYGYNMEIPDDPMVEVFTGACSHGGVKGDVLVFGFNIVEPVTEVFTGACSHGGVKGDVLVFGFNIVEPVTEVFAGTGSHGGIKGEVLIGF